MTTTLEPLLDVREVARLYRLSTAHVRRLHARGDLPAVRFSPGGHLRFRPEQVEAALNERFSRCEASYPRQPTPLPTESPPRRPGSARGDSLGAERSGAG